MEVFEIKNDQGIIVERFEGKIEKGKVIKDGKYESWYNSGVKESEGEYLENTKFGVWTYWDMTGNLLKKMEFIQNRNILDWESELNAVPETVEIPEAKQAYVQQSVNKESNDFKSAVNANIADIKKANVNSGHSVPENIIPDNYEEKPALFVRSDVRYEDDGILDKIYRVNPLYYVIAILSIIFVIVVITFVPGRRGIDTTAEDLKNSASYNSGDTISIIKNKFNDWLRYTNNKEIDSLMKLYAREVNYYRMNQTKVDNVEADKKKFFNSNREIKVTASNINIQVENKVRYICTYDKSFSFINSAGTVESGKLKSRLIFQLINDEFLIVTEKDDKKY